MSPGDVPEAPDPDDRSASDPAIAPLLAELRRALGPDEDVPVLLADLAHAAFSGVDLDRELAVLVSSVEPVGVRGDDDTLSFAAASGWRLEVRLRPAGLASVASGSVSLASAGRIGWESAAGGSGWADVEDGGFFELPGVPPGSVRFVVESHGDDPITCTDWFTA